MIVPCLGMFPIEFIGEWEDDLGRKIIITMNDSTPVVTFLNSKGKPFRLTIPFKKTKNLTSKWVESEMKLVVEAGIKGLGPTFDLQFVEIPTGYEIHTGVSMGIYDDYRDDFGVPWAYPLNSFIQTET